MNRNAQQVAENQTVRARVSSVLRADCDSSLKCGFADCFPLAGFASEADAIRTLARDFVSGRIKYTGGMLSCQEKNSEPGNGEGQQDSVCATESSRAENMVHGRGANKTEA